jgi:hypothetical protein
MYVTQNEFGSISPKWIQLEHLRDTEVFFLFIILLSVSFIVISLFLLRIMINIVQDLCKRPGPSRNVSEFQSPNFEI